jgi:hypothetical protein
MSRQHEKKTRRKKGKVQHIYMTGKEKAHDKKRRRTYVYVRAEKKERE